MIVIACFTKILMQKIIGEGKNYNNNNNNIENHNSIAK